MKTKFVRSANHSIYFSNKGKIDKLELFRTEYIRVSSIYLDHVWNNKIEYKTKKGSFFFDIQNNSFDIPLFLDKKAMNGIILSTNLSARALKCCLTQVLGIVRASTEKQRKRLYVYYENKEKGHTKKQLKLLIKAIQTNNPVKPKLDNMNIELNSICCDYKKTESNMFNGFFQLKSIGTKYGKIRIPIKETENDQKWNKGKMLKSFLITKKGIQIRYEIEVPWKKEGRIVGADQGYKTILTLSDGQITPVCDNKGKNLESIIIDGCKNKKGSNNFNDFQEERENFINWSINQLDLSNIKQINLEEIFNINYKKSSSNKMKKWTNSLIVDKIKSIAEEQGVFVQMQTSTYRSQRCSCCGNVRKANRKGKIYQCKNCGNMIDADLNASLNHEICLPDIPWTLRKQRMNLGSGFFWKETGFYSFNGEELTVPHLPL